MERVVSKNLPCADCGKMMYRGSTSRPEGKARCHPCRRIRSDRLATCARCGATFIRHDKSTRYCSAACFGLAIRTRLGDGSRERRMRRERTVGLTSRQRKKLMAMWIKQGKRCAYCPALADTVDHVLPLILGGTNYEGNLAPCCRRCNSSKSGLMMIEWRTGRRTSRDVTRLVMPSLTKPKPKREKPAVQIELRICPICSALYEQRTKRCSSACEAEHCARYMRDRYRTKRGLPVDPKKPTRPTTRIFFRGDNEHDRHPAGFSL